MKEAKSQRDGHIPWHERAFVTQREAAEICARSVDWVRAQIGIGRLNAAQLTKGGPTVVTVESLRRLIDAATAAPAPAQPPAGIRPFLIVDNA